MCDFLFLGFRKEPSGIRDRFRAAGLEIAANANASVARRFPRECGAVLVVTHGGCSCDLVGGGRTGFDEPREREKLARKGWSAAKIDRAIAGKRPSGARSDTQESFRARVSEEAQLAGELYAYAHLFKGNIALEEVPPAQESETTPLVLDAVPAAWPIDRLVCVRGGAPAR